MEPDANPPRWKTLLAFAIIYLVWGSTFLAIRIGVKELPPLLFAAMRFLAAGIILFAWTLTHGERLPARRQWASIFLLAFLIFVIDYGCLFWAEQRTPSGVAAVMMATIPLFTALSEILFLRTQKLTLRLVAALLIGLCGVAVLVIRSFNIGGQAIQPIGALALIAGAVSWSIASILTRKLPLPASKIMSSGSQMLSGGIMLTIAAAAFGEFHSFDPLNISAGAWLAPLYLIVPGSIIGFTAYLWLLHHESPTKVGTYAYVNPVVAVILGYMIGGESLGMRTVLGTFFVLISVVVITTTRSKKPVTAAKA